MPYDNDNDFDFRYACFSLSAYTLENYIKDAIVSKKLVKNPYDSYGHSNGIIDDIISCIASQDFKFKANNKRVFKLLYKMLRDYAHDNGIYSDKARKALRVLCLRCGFAADSLVLTDHAPMGRMARFKQKFCKWFGDDKPRDEQEDKIDQLFDMVSQQNNKTLISENERAAELQRMQEEDQARIAEAQRMREEAARRAQEVHAKGQTENAQEGTEKKTRTPAPRSKKTLVAAIGATITGVALLGASMLFGAHGPAGASIQDNDKAPMFKTIDAMPVAHYKLVATYNVFDSVQKQKSNLDSVLQYRVPTTKMFAQAKEMSDSLKPQQPMAENQTAAVALTKASRSALNILIGTKRAQKLCDNVQSKVDAGIFKLPDGMSVERVAHAMQMSRVYEGRSVILDALNSNEKLTDEQQRAFDNHIASIGDLGVKLQKRIAAKRNLNKYSRYDNANETLRMAHAKNLEQLRQIRNRAC